LRGASRWGAGGYQGQTALLSRGLTVCRAHEGGWGGTPTPRAGLATAASLSFQKGFQRGRWPNGPPKTKPGPGARQQPALFNDHHPLLLMPCNQTKRTNKHSLSNSSITEGLKCSFCPCTCNPQIRHRMQQRN
jgi:hypothetical protein